MKTTVVNCAVKKLILSAACVVMFTAAAAPAAKADLWLDHPHYKLPGASSRGHSWSSALKLSQTKTSLASVDPKQFPLPGKRPTPTADFMAAGIPGKQGNVKYQKVPVELLEESGTARNAAVNFGFPLPAGALFDLAQIRLTDGKKELSASFSITAKHPDSSIKWLFVRTSSNLSANEKKNIFIEFGSSLPPRKAPAGAVSVKLEKNIYHIDNGVIKAKINPERFTFVNEIVMNKRFLGSINAFGTLFILKDGKRMGSYRLVPRSVKLIEQTPEVVTFKIDGDYWDIKGPLSSYVARVTFRRGVPGFDITYTHINTNMRYEFLDVKSLTLGFSAGKTAKNKIVSWHHFTAGTSVPANAVRVVQLDDRTISADGKKFEGRIPAGIKFTMADGMEAAITVADGWKRYPKGFAVEQKSNTVQTELLPELPDENFGRDLPYYLQFPFCGGAHRMKWGTAFTERISFRFGKKLSVPALAAEADMPVLAMLPAKWYAEAGVWRGMGVPEFYSGIDAEAQEIFKRNLERREKHREYGMFNYGDTFGERSMQNWTNNEYDMAHGMFLFALRSGNREALRFALAAARHDADVDVVHAYMVPYFVGCKIQHSCAHTGTYGKWSWPYRSGFNDGYSGHVWLRGMVDAWHLFGDDVAMNSAYMVADHLTFAWLPGLDKLVQIRDGAWNLIALCEIASATGDPAYRKAADELAEYMMNLINTKTDWYLDRRGKTPRGAGIATFMCGVILNSLCDYYELSKRQDVAEKCADMARWIVRKAFAPEFGGLFWYDITNFGKSNFASAFLNALISPGIIRAGAITGDKQLFSDGLMAYKALMMRHVPEDGKSVALHLLFMEDVNQAVSFYAAKTSSALPGGFKRDRWRKELYSRQDGSLMARGKIRFVIIPEKEGVECKLVWNNYNGGARGKVVIKKLTVKDADGKVIAEHDDVRPDSMRKEFAFKLDKAGSRYTFEADCTDHSLWSVAGSEDYKTYYDTGCNIGLISNVSTRLEFEQKAGEKIHFEYLPLHRGYYGFTLSDTEGEVLCERKGFKGQTKMSAEQAGVKYEISAAGKERKLILELYSGNGAILKMSPAVLVSRPRTGSGTIPGAAQN